MRSEMISKVGLGFVVSILMLSSVAIAQNVPELINQLKKVGVFDFYLPFLLFFAILYGILIKTKVFGEGKGVAAVVSLAAAAFLMIATPVGLTISQFLANFASGVLVVILTVVVILILVNVLVSGDIIPKPSSVAAFQKSGGVIILVILMVLVAFSVFIASGGTAIFPGLKTGPKELFSTIGGLSPAVIGLIILIVSIGLVVLFSGKAGGGGQGQS